MQNRQLRKMMLKRFKENKSTFRIEYIKEHKKSYIYVLDNQLIGSIDMDSPLPLEERMTQIDRFKGATKDTIGTILLSISSLILLKKLNPIINEAYVFPPSKFFEKEWQAPIKENSE